jgi:hypothetical protein
MAGFMPAIHVFGAQQKQGVDGRDVRREDGASRLLPGHDEVGRRCGYRLSPALAGSAGMTACKWNERGKA